MSLHFDTPFWFICVDYTRIDAHANYDCTAIRQFPIGNITEPKYISNPLTFLVKRPLSVGIFP